jgi:hypothetical protein
VLGTNSVHFGKSYTFRGTWGVGTFGTDYKWIQFAGPSMIVDGYGLKYTGNILNVDMSDIDLDDINDVNTGTPSDGDVLTYDNGTSTWISAPIPVPTGILIPMTNANGGTINKGDVVYVSAANSVDLGDADNISTAGGVIGVVADATIVTTAVGNICTHGLVTGLVGLTAGATYYLSETPGQPTSTAPSAAGTWVVPIGIATSTTDLLVNVGTPIQN